MIRTGLCSVALRRSSRTEVVRAVSAAGLSIIEWGGDIHVPPGEQSSAREARMLCEDAGIVTASYGSYFRPGVDPIGDFAAVLDTAVLLGAPRIRVWAGRYGSTQCPPDARGRVVDDLNEIADVAAAAEVSLSLEHHAGTLADSAEATLRLLGSVTGPNVAAYWQPALGLSDADAVAELDLLSPRVDGVHLFCWTADEQRFPLDTRESLWSPVFERLRRLCRPIDAFVEFVPDDDPDAVIRDGAVLVDYART